MNDSNYSVLYPKFNDELINRDGWSGAEGKAYHELKRKPSAENVRKHLKRYEFKATIVASHVDQVYHICQNVSETHQVPFNDRSMMMGDVIYSHETKTFYVVKDIGFEPISSNFAKLILLNLVICHPLPLQNSENPSEKSESKGKTPSISQESEERPIKQIIKRFASEIIEHVDEHTTVDATSGLNDLTTDISNSIDVESLLEEFLGELCSEDIIKIYRP